MKCLVIVLALAAPCYAQHITVSDQVPPPAKYPAEVYKMSNADFIKWAADFNKKQVADVEVRRAKITEDKWVTGQVTRTNESHTEYGDYGNGCGYGGGCSAYGFDYNGYLSYCGVRSGSSSQQSMSYPVRWPNPAYYGPGPLTIVNPYCQPTK